MSTEVVVSGGGALIPASTGSAVGEHIGDLSRETTQSFQPPSFDWSPRDPETLADIRRQILRDLVIDGISQRVIDLCLPVLDDNAPAMRAAYKTSNRQEQARVAHSVREQLLRKGLITLEQIERIRPILQRYSQESERALIGPNANVTYLIDEMRELDSLMAQPGSRYWKGSDADRLQQRWCELHDQGVRADGERSAAAGDAKGGEIERYLGRIGEIERYMRAPAGSADFKRYWDNPQMQEEYRELQRRRE